jgi:hypothetical protein
LFAALMYFFFIPKGHSVRNKYSILLNMASVYHIVAIRVN